MRALCTVQTISKLDKIEGKDKIVLASFENTGWHVIVGTDMKVGDRVIYCEYDTILPIKTEFEFLRKRCYNSLYDGFRIKSMKMGGVYSEGIVFPTSILSMDGGKFKDGMDVTSQIGAIKYDPEALEEATLQTKKKHGPFMRFLLKIPFVKNILYPKKKSGKWPEFISKTDETRVQILQYVFEKYKDLPVYVTEKIDGQSATFFYNKKEFGVCSRNLRLPRPNKIKGKHAVMQSKYWQTAEKFDIENGLKQASRDLGINLYIQGEQAGPGIQGNKYGFENLRLFVFNIYDITHKRYFSTYEIDAFCAKYRFETVPHIANLHFNWSNADELVEFAKGNSLYGGNVLREGVVIRSITPMPPDIGMSNMWSLKCISPDFTEKWGNNDYSTK
jgi:RNA ligase (TIGR02306 family)